MPIICPYGVALLLDGPKHTLPKNVLCQVWLKLVHWFLRQFLKVVIVLSLFCNYLLLEKSIPGSSSFGQISSFSAKDVMCQVWLKSLNAIKVHLLLDFYFTWGWPFF